jgi:hypothetical protein
MESGLKRSGKGTTVVEKTKLFTNSRGNKKNKVKVFIFILKTPFV